MEKTAPKGDFRSIFKRWFWRLFVLGFLSIILIFTFINIGWIGYLPDIEELQNPKNKFATEIYSSDQQLLGTFYINNRVEVHYNDISKNVLNALIATEDSRFYSHSGIDGRSVARAIIKRGVFMQKSAGGGSTITQQLAKQLYSPRAGNFFERAFQKPIEWVISVKLERLYTKEEIITMYLNQVGLYNNAIGIKSAAQIYFSTLPSKLKIEEAATLIGMCKNPKYFNPVRYNQRVKERRNVVLNQMRKAEFITNKQFDSLKVLPLVLKYQPVDHKVGLATYFREYLRTMLTAKEPDQSDYASWQQDKYEQDKKSWETNPLYGFCNKNKKADGSPYNIYTDGLKIYTTIDSRMQRFAEEAVKEHMTGLQNSFFKEKKNKKNAPFARSTKQEDIDATMSRAMKQSNRYYRMKIEGLSDSEIKDEFIKPVEMQVYTYKGLVDTIMSPIDSIRYSKFFLRCGFMSMNPHTGEVKAYIGGPDFSQFQYDMVNAGKRQVGSTIKPYLYTLAMEEGMSPCDKTPWQPPTTLLNGDGSLWQPKTTTKGKNVGDMVSLRWGLTNSDNWISASLMERYNPEAMVKMMRSFGVTGDIPAVPSLCLGTCEISVAEMVGAYTAFPNKGIRVEPIYVTRIEDANGNVIGKFAPQKHEIFSETTSYKMIYMMQGVVNEGTGNRIRRSYGLNMPIGGKTGTTQNNSDGWFMGYTPSLVSGVWVGGEDRFIHFDNIGQGQGASMALPIWALYMKKVLADRELGYSSGEQFDIPSTFDGNSGCEANEFQ
jgi:penicillin-binding protein 1A